MNIVILGDSWGVPNTYSPLMPDPRTHTEYLLKDLGYNVHNCAQNSGSNLYSINRAINYAKNNQVDWILWFHTDLPRDLGPLIEPTTIDNLIEGLAHQVYSRARDLKSLTNAKFAVVGGCSPVHPLLYSYLTPDFLVDDWTEDICQVTLPKIYIISHKVHSNPQLNLPLRSIVPYLIDDRESLINLYNQILKRFLATKKSEHFPDDLHPGAGPHADLVNTLKNTLP